MRRRQFEQQLRDLLRAPVEGLDGAEKAVVVGRHVEALVADGASPRFAIRFEPFVPGRRPDDEAAYPGLGSSEQVGLFNPDRSPSDHVKLLVRCSSDGCAVSQVPPGAAVTATIEAIDDAGQALDAVAGWSARDVTSCLVPVGAPAGDSDAAGTPRALELDLDVNEVFAPADPDLLEQRLGFGSLFRQRFRVTLDIEARHRGRKFDASKTVARASAVGLTGITGSEEADSFTWAVDKTSTRIEADGTLVLVADLAKQGELDPPDFALVSQLYFISYQVTVRTAF